MFRVPCALCSVQFAVFRVPCSVFREQYLLGVSMSLVGNLSSAWPESETPMLGSTFWGVRMQEVQKIQKMQEMQDV